MSLIGRNLLPELSLIDLYFINTEREEEEEEEDTETISSSSSSSAPLGPINIGGEGGDAE